MNIQDAIKKRDQLKIDIGVLEARKNAILAELRTKFGTDDLNALRKIKADKEAELAAATATKERIEAELDKIFAGA